MLVIQHLINTAASKNEPTVEAAYDEGQSEAEKVAFGRHFLKLDVHSLEIRI